MQNETAHKKKVSGGGGGGGGICHSETYGERMRMASGESDIYFGTEVGNWGAGNFFLACQRRKKDFFFLPLVPTLKKKCSDFCGEFKCE